MNKLLLRQLRRLKVSEESIKKEAKLLSLISDTYEQHKEELEFVEHSLFVLSSELNEKNDVLEKQLNIITQSNLENEKMSAELYSIIDATDEAIIAFDEQGNLTHTNKAAKKLLEDLNIPTPTTERDVLKQCLNDDANEVVNTLKNSREEKVHGKCALNGNLHYQYFSAPILSEKMVFKGRVWSFRDISFRAHTDELFKYQALHDSLTGLPNRVSLSTRVEKAISKHEKRRSSFSLFHVELYRLKLLNDLHGYEAGNATIIDIAHRISMTISDGEELFRSGGNDMVLFVPGEADDEKMKEKAQLLISCISEPFLINDMKFNISCVVGASRFPKDASTAHDVLHKSDIALSHAKNLEISYTLYDEKIGEEFLKQTQLEKDLRIALEEEQLKLYLQPKVETKHMKIVGAEALLRWPLSDGSFIPPDVFIPMAEKTGLIRKIGKFVLSQSCKILSDWKQMGIEQVTIAINLSIAEFNDPDLVNSILETIKKYDVSPASLIIEVTESLFMSDKNLVKSIMLELGDHGFVFALDDFGTGYSSLSYLQDLPFTYLKIDRSFLDNILGDRRKESLSKSIIDIGNNLGLKIVAEGIETKEVLEFICDKTKNKALAQGFYLFRPMPYEELTDILKNER